MRRTKQMSITLPHEMADELRHRVEAGQYASESEVIREGLRALFAREAAVEEWLNAQVAQTYDAVMTSDERLYTADEVRSRVRRSLAG